MIKGFLCLFWNCEYIDKQQAITWIIIPMICALVWVCIPIAMDNSLSNEKFKISLDRLKFHRQNFCKDKDGNNVDWSNSRGFDTEFKFIYKNRWKNYDELLDLMKDDYYREEKYLNEISDKKITKNRFLKDWIEDHFIY